MLTKSIIDKNNKTYQVSVDDKTFSREKTTMSHTMSWSVNYSVTDEKNELVGFGHFLILCSLDHEHFPTHDNDKMLKALLNKGSKKIIDNINNNEPIESVRYRMPIINCLE